MPPSPQVRSQLASRSTYFAETVRARQNSILNAAFNSSIGAAFSGLISVLRSDKNSLAVPPPAPQGRERPLRLLPQYLPFSPRALEMRTCGAEVQQTADSPDYLDGKLNLTRSCLCGGDEPGTALEMGFPR